MTEPQVIQPRDQRERHMIECYERDLRERWDVAVGPLIRRKSDGKLIRMPNRGPITRADPQVATDAFVLGRGPGAEYGVQLCWIETAKTFMDRPQVERARALERALRNEQVYREGVEASRLAERAVEPRRKPLLKHLRAEQLGMTAPVHRTAPKHRVLAAAAD